MFVTKCLLKIWINDWSNFNAHSCAKLFCAILASLVTGSIAHSIELACHKSVFLCSRNAQASKLQLAGVKSIRKVPEIPAPSSLLIELFLVTISNHSNLLVACYNSPIAARFALFLLRLITICLYFIHVRFKVFIYFNWRLIISNTFILFKSYSNRKNILELIFNTFKVIIYFT